MNTLDYWTRRAIEREQRWQSIATRELNEKVKLYYEQSLEKIQRDIAALYAKYATENGLSMTEARRLIRGDEFRVWRMTLEEYVKASKNDSAILKELNTLAMRSRISRFEALHARTLMEIADLCEKLEKFEDALQYRAYIANYYGNLYDIHKGYGLSTPPVAVDKKKAENVIRTPWNGANYSTRIWNNGSALEKAIEATMLTAIHRGSSIQKLSQDLSKRMNVAYNNAERLVRTELNYVQTKAAADSIVAAEMGYYQFIAVMDNRTTPICQSLDGEIFPIVELSQGENAPPMHVRCRSTICASIDDGKQGRKPTGQRTARDEEGKRIKVPADMRYADWKAVYIDKTTTLEDWRKAKDAEYAAQRNEIAKRENRDLRGLAAGNKFYPNIEGTPPKLLTTISNLTPDLLNRSLQFFEAEIAKSAIENAVIFTSLGEVYHCTGDLNGIPMSFFDELGEKLNGATVTHNHPPNSGNEYTFSNDDIILFKKFKLARLRGVDEKFIYEMDNDFNNVDEIPTRLVDEQNLKSDKYWGHHKAVVIQALNEKFGYRRRLK